ncbi:uncharacterized protein BDR25DRAFT_276256 [Lindgomyces ingoldianus]|uniref:Uncharacterized protein n=1 Tax=Lindgomyces ingoldianus TaxID=673940 RepID=A0ACB6RGZ8_9PLEO|nr:uncharacterized protein BDR25DRAFT_276256 [Lindgomyces ingoldianus]KAF2478335.1 hypothetical protein BDR25DRAFT_276256 [Lindgomyces ingoldianus]
MADSTTVIRKRYTVDTSQFDFDDHSSNSRSVRTTNITLIVLVGIFVSLRLFVRICMVRKVFVDDILILVASVLTVALAAVCIAATNHGMGTHVWLLDMPTMLQTIKSAVQYLFICQVLYAFAVAFTKISIIASYLRFVQEKRFRISMLITAVVIGGLWITGVFVTIFQCRPVSAAWDFTNLNGKCVNYVDYLYASSALTVATDIVLCVLPWPYFWKLQMSLKQRIILCLLLGGGAGACVASVLRITKLDMLRNADLTYQAVPTLNLSVIECSVGIICVSIPPLRPLAVRLFPRALLNNQLPSIRSTPQTARTYSLSKLSANTDNNSGSQTEHDAGPTFYREHSSEAELGRFRNMVEVSGDSQKEYWKLNS